MQYPNQRYGNPEILRHYAQFTTTKELSKRFKRSERTIRNWLSGAERVPFWVPELLRLQDMERREILRQMGIPYKAPLALRSSSGKPKELVQAVRILGDIGKATSEEIRRDKSNNVERRIVGIKP